MDAVIELLKHIVLIVHQVYFVTDIHIVVVSKIY
jgi:hypothetical protein